MPVHNAVWKMFKFYSCIPKANYHLSKNLFFILTCGCEKLSDPCMKFSRKSLTQGTSSIILLSLPLAPRFPTTILKDFCFVFFSLGSDLEVLLVTVTFSNLYRIINFSFLHNHFPMPKAIWQLQNFQKDNSLKSNKKN